MSDTQTTILVVLLIWSVLLSLVYGVYHWRFKRRDGDAITLWHGVSLAALLYFLIFAVDGEHSIFVGLYCVLLGLVMVLKNEHHASVSLKMLVGFVFISNAIALYGGYITG